VIRQKEHLPLEEPEGRGHERHIPELDGIRGLAALAVVFYHAAQLTVTGSHGILHAFLDISLFGDLGVDVFFALSGFLITGILLRKRERPHYYRNFYMRRVLRLAPPYLLILLIVAVFVPSSRQFLLLSLVYLANFCALFHIPMAYGPLWSLSVEEHFYLIWPSAVRFLPDRWVLFTAMAFALGCPALRIFFAFHGGYNTYLSWYRFDGMAWGAILAWLIYRGKRIIPYLRLAAVAGAAALTLGLVWYRLNKETADAVLYAASGLLTVGTIGLAVLRRKEVSWLSRRGFRFFGDISYWLYLIHFFFLYCAYRWVERYAASMLSARGELWLFLMAFTLGGSIITGVLVRRFIELPILGLKRRFA
jgi:peptidoglycan/LPS O-acetylase OafA/YrhL